MKKLILATLLMVGISITAQAEEGHWYAGFNVGQSINGFGLLDKLDTEYPIDDPTLQFLVGSDHLHLDTTEEFEKYSSNSLFFGRTFGKNRSHALEFALTDFGKYSVKVNGFAQNPGPDFNIGDAQYTSSFDTTATGSGTGSVKGVSLVYLHFFHLGKEKKLSVFPKVGVNYLWADVKANVRVRGEGYVDTVCDGEDLVHCRVGVFGEMYKNYERKNYHIPSATVGAGIAWKVDDHWKVRGEYTRTGLPWGEPYVDTYSIGFMYHF